MSGRGAAKHGQQQDTRESKYDIVDSVMFVERKIFSVDEYLEVIIYGVIYISCKLCES